MASKHDRYNKKTYEDIKVRVPKGKKTVIQNRADELGQSLNGYIVGVIEKEMQTVKGANFSLASKDTEK